MILTSLESDDVDRRQSAAAITGAVHSARMEILWQYVCVDPYAASSQ
jgi:hypothetical protein